MNIVSIMAPSLLASFIFRPSNAAAITLGGTLTVVNAASKHHFWNVSIIMNYY